MAPLLTNFFEFELIYLLYVYGILEEMENLICFQQDTAASESDDLTASDVAISKPVNNGLSGKKREDILPG